MKTRKPGLEIGLLRWLLGMVTCWLLWSCQAAALPQGTLVKVSRVVSGQALEVLDLSRQTTKTDRVRLLGVEAPDLKQDPWGADAKAQLETLVAGQTLLLETDQEAQNNYGQRLAYLWKDGVLVNEKIVEAGQALAASRSPNIKYQQRLNRAQEKARLLGLGIWNPTRPMRQTPSEFRAQQPS
jgi:micrococcal nuclease